MNAGFWLLTTLSAGTAILLAGRTGTLLLRRHAAWENALWRTVFVLLLAVPLASLARGRAPATRWQPVKSVSLAVDEWTWKNVGPVLAGPMLALPAPPASAPAAVSRRAIQKRAGGPSLLHALFLLWAAGALLGIGRLALGAARVGGLVRHARPLAAAGDALLADCARTAGVSRPALRASGAVASPLLAGWLRPCILVPTAAEAPSREVLLHELAHLRRRDLWWMTLAHLAGALWWFHPLAWNAARRMERSAENVCDDLVVRWSGDAAGYAAQLLAFARGGPPARGLALAGVAVTGFRSGLGQRIARLLAPGHREQVAIGRAGAALLAAGAAAVLGLILAATPGRASDPPAVKDGPGASEPSAEDPSQLIHDFHVTSNYEPVDKVSASEVISMSSLRQGMHYDDAQAREATRRLYLTRRFEFVRVYGKPVPGGGWNVEIAYTPKTALPGKAVAGASVPGVAGGESASGLAAMVNRAPIYTDQVESFNEPCLRALQTKFKGEELDRQISAFRKAALEDLVDRELILQDFGRKGYTIPEEILDGRVAAIIQEECGGSHVAFAAKLARENLTEEGYRQRERDGIVVRAMGYQVIGTSVPPPGKERSDYVAERQRRQEAWLKGLREKAEIKILAKY